MGTIFVILAAIFIFAITIAFAIGAVYLVYLFIGAMVEVFKGKAKLGDMCCGSDFLDEYRRRNNI